MRRMLLCMVVLGFAALPASAQKIMIDYARDFDFSKVKTFQYVANEEPNAPGDLMGARIDEGIVSRLKARGLQQVDSNPDLYVTYHIVTQENEAYVTTDFGYGGWGPGWHSWGASYGTSVTSATTYTMGTLIVDAYEPREKKTVWHGAGTVTVKESPEKRTKQIDKILTKMAERWQQILAGKGK